MAASDNVASSFRGVSASDQRRSLATSSSAKRISIWRSDWFAGVLVVVAVMAVHLSTDLLSGLERRFYDLASTSSDRRPSDQVVVIAIDDQSIANIGRWPWPRDIHARLIDQLSAAKVKTIVHTAFFFEPQLDRGLPFIRQIRDVLGSGVEPPADPASVAVLPNEQRAQLAKIVAQAEVALDTDALLAASIKNAGNVLVPSVFVLGVPQGRPDSPLPAYAAKSSLEAIGAAAAGIGHLNQFADVDGTVRQEPLLVNYYGKSVPSLALLAATRGLNLSPADIQLNVGESVQIGKIRIKTDEAALMLPQFYKGQDGRPAFVEDSFFDVLNGKIPASKYADRIVVIGATAAGVGAAFPVPGYASLSSAQAVAHITSSILSQHFIAQPVWGIWVVLGVFLLVAAYVVAGLPRLSAATAATVTLLVFAALLATELVLLERSAIWLKLIFPASLLVLGHLALTTKRFLVAEAGKLKSDEESAETNRMMGLALQGQGQLDMAFDRFRRVPLGEALMGNLYSLALDFERKRQFNKAQSVYEHMKTYDPGFKDLEARLGRVKNLSETVMLGGHGAHSGATLVQAGASVEKPMLGRYQINKELGKGAMGVVYLGKDPKIGRVVAIKTLALSQEFEGDELVDARERFFREAETAGRLNHPNIVSILTSIEEDGVS